MAEENSACSMCLSWFFKFLIVLAVAGFLVFEFLCIGFGSENTTRCSSNLAGFLISTGVLGMMWLFGIANRMIFIAAATLVPLKVREEKDPNSVEGLYNKLTQSGTSAIYADRPENKVEAYVNNLLTEHMKYFLWIVDVLESMFAVAFCIFGAIEIRNTDSDSCDHSLYYLSIIQDALLWLLVIVFTVSTVMNIVKFYVQYQATKPIES